MNNSFVDKVLKNGRDLYLIQAHSKFRNSESTDLILLNLLNLNSKEIPTENSSYKDVKLFFNNYFNVTYLNKQMPSEQKIMFGSFDYITVTSLQEIIDEVFGRSKTSSVESYIALKMDYRVILQRLINIGLDDKKSNKLWAYRESILNYLTDLKNNYYQSSKDVHV